MQPTDGKHHKIRIFAHTQRFDNETPSPPAAALRRHGGLGPEPRPERRTLPARTDGLPDRFARKRPRAARAPAQHAQHRGRARHHVPPAQQPLRDDAPLPHAEHGRAVVRPRLLAHADRGARQAAAAALRRLHLLTQAGLLDPAGIRGLRRRGAAQRKHEHRARRHRLLRAQRPLEHRLRPDQDQGQPRAHQLVERPAVRRPQHRQQPVQPRPRLRYLRRVQHARGRRVQPLGQRFRHAGRGPQLGFDGQRRHDLHGASGALPAGTLLGEGRPAGGRFRP